MRILTVFLLVMLAAVASASAQAVETDPLQCWWRTSTAAVRVGEPFSVVLTCAVVETDAVKVVPDEAPLDPPVMQMPPFEVLGGMHQADLRTDDHRFLQYQYRLRLVAEDYFGKDVKLPDTKISYHLQSRTGEGPAIEGRELTYFLPPMSVRVLSLVAGDETDIRDASSSTFGDLESRTFQADLLRTVGGVLFALAGLAILIAAVRLLGPHRARSATDSQLVPDVAILRQVGRELSAIGRERHAAGWTPALTDRLMTALRIAAGYALSRRVIQVPITPSPNHPITQPPHSFSDGQLVVGTGWIRRKQVVIAGSVTPEGLRHRLAMASTGGAQAMPKSGFLKDLERALNSLTLKQYGREARVEDQALDEALDVGVRTVRRLTADHTWIGKKLTSINQFLAAPGQRAWSR